MLATGVPKALETAVPRSNLAGRVNTEFVVEPLFRFCDAVQILVSVDELRVLAAGRLCRERWRRQTAAGCPSYFGAGLCQRDVGAVIGAAADCGRMPQLRWAAYASRTLVLQSVAAGNCGRCPSYLGWLMLRTVVRGNRSIRGNLVGG